MKIVYSSLFSKHFNKRLTTPQKEKCYQRIKLFQKDPSNPLLEDHALKGGKRGYRAFSVAGDLRIIYYFRNSDAYLVDIGTHNQVY